MRSANKVDIRCPRCVLPTFQGTGPFNLGWKAPKAQDFAVPCRLLFDCE